MVSDKVPDPCLSKLKSLNINRNHKLKFNSNNNLPKIIYSPSVVVCLYLYKIFIELQLDHQDYATGYIEALQKSSEFW